MLTLHDSMKLQSRLGRDIIFIDRPTGFSLKALADIHSESLTEKFLPLPQLDVEIEGKMTGASLLCRGGQRGQELQTAAKAGQIRQKFQFVTDRVSSDLSFQKTTHGGGSVEFRRIKRSPFFELWETSCSPLEARELRSILTELGLPILGDLQHGGTAFPHFCLHASELEVPGEEIWQCPSPRIFERLGVAKDLELARWLMAADSRQRLYDFLRHPEQALRLAHEEVPGLRWDALGPVLWGAWYREADPDSLDLQRFEFFATVVGKKFRVRKMLNRGQDPLSRIDWAGENCPESWVANEGQMKFHFHSQRGLSAGLFLDQRQNREFVLKNSRGLQVLNLFAYTCGFSVAAALGGAQQVASVDVSREFLDWGQENFSLNRLDPKSHEFFKQDSLLFLKGSIKRGRKFDLVICDPPSFGRNKDSVFSLEKNLEDLLDLCHQVMAPKATLLFSCNLEKWSQSELSKRVARHGKFKSLPTPEPAWDFESPGQTRLLKTLCLRTHP
jgi:23S rRNA (cytosine1962-C5)-methyltransferase